MKLWHLLIGVCFTMPVGTALGPARAAQAGPDGYVLATAIGIAVGACCGWTMWWVHKAIVPHLLHRLEKGDPLTEWYGRAFYLSKVLWIAFAGCLGLWLSSAALKTLLGPLRH